LLASTSSRSPSASALGGGGESVARRSDLGNVAGRWLDLLTASERRGHSAQSRHRANDTPGDEHRGRDAKAAQ